MGSADRGLAAQRLRVHVQFATLRLRKAIPAVAIREIADPGRSPAQLACFAPGELAVLAPAVDILRNLAEIAPAGRVARVARIAAHLDVARHARAAGPFHD